MDCEVVNFIGVNGGIPILTHLGARRDTILSNKQLEGYWCFIPDAFVHGSAAKVR